MCLSNSWRVSVLSQLCCRKLLFFCEAGQRPISLWMEGPADGIALLSTTLEKLEQATAKQMARESLVSQVTVPKMLMRPKQEFRRFTLRYLSVGSRMITAEGQ